MSRTQRTERTTPKNVQRKAPRPRMNEFAAKWYEDHGYTVTAPVEPQGRPYLEADDND